MKPYQLNVPTKVYFGRNIWKDALKEQEFFLKGNVMIVTTGRSLTRMGYVDDLKKQMEALPLTKTVCIFDSVSANPRITEVRSGISMGREEKTDVIVGFGGGSAMDAAKAIAVGIGTQEDIGIYFYEAKEAVGHILPIVAIPTTAGTGSELSKAAILTDDQQKIKNGIRGEALYPTVAIVDSVFTESIPVKTTIETGFDVFAHAAESYISKVSSPYTRMQSEYAIHIVGAYLPKLYTCPQDIEAREKMSFASMIMGINLGNASTCLPHRLQYPLGAHTDTSHGAGLSALFTAWTTYEHPYAAKEMERITELLTGETVCGNKECSRKICQFIRSLGLPSSLQELGVDKALLPVLASQVTGNIKNDPAAQEKDIISKIYRQAWREE